MKFLVLLACLLPLRLSALLPLPAEIHAMKGYNVLSGPFKIKVLGKPDARVQAALKRFEARLGLKGEAGLPLTVTCKSSGLKIQGLREDESYKLEIWAKGVDLEAATPLGILHGLETLRQLVVTPKDRPSDFRSTEISEDASMILSEATIKDKPRFPWRGLLMDVCRHWLPLDVVKRNVDGLAAAKMNVLHWHLSEDQGFRVESRKFPKLHEMGSDGNYYTQEQVKELVAYARERGVRVVPEFDMPGHVTAWLVGYPELGSAPGPYSIERKFGIFDPALDPSREEVFNFLENFLAEMAALFPDEYFHTGGDENNGKQWNTNPAIQKFMAQNKFKTNEDLQAYFSGRVSKILQKLGKKMMGWDEIMHTELPPGTVVHAWRGKDSLVEASKRGFDTVLSNGYYLDLQRPAKVHYENDPAAASLSLTAQQLTHVLGGEACMWAELVDPESVDARIWPRNLAVAERLWSPASVSDLADHHRRAETLSGQMSELGLRHRSDYLPRLEALVGKEAAPDLKVMADHLSQIQHYQRHRSRVYLQSTPLDRLVDAVRAESSAAFWFRHHVDGHLAGGKGFEEPVERSLKAWVSHMPAAKAALQSGDKTMEAVQLADDLAELGQIGLSALENLRRGEAIQGKAEEALLKRLDRLAQPKAELELACLPAVRKLVLATANQGKLKELGASEWSKWLDGKLDEVSKQKRH